MAFQIGENQVQGMWGREGGDMHLVLWLCRVVQVSSFDAHERLHIFGEGIECVNESSAYQWSVTNDVKITRVNI